jgi:methylmalonyl-CoA mutase
MKFHITTLQNWEETVKKQLKTDDIYSVLTRENLEGVVVKPYYTEVSKAVSLPKVEKSALLVAPYNDVLKDEAFAFFIKNKPEIHGKTFFFDNENLAENLALTADDEAVSLVDLFDDAAENPKKIEEEEGKKLLAVSALKRNIGVNAALLQNAGAGIVQQLAFALAKAKDLAEIYGEEVLDKLSFRFAIGGNYFFEIAKIRAFKLVFNELGKEYGKTLTPYIYAETSLRNKAKNDVENNLIRSTFELAGAMIGGADAVYSNNFKPENDSQTQEISFKQLLVLAYESILNVFQDSAEGGYYVENLTEQFAEKAWKLFLEIEEKGGDQAALENGTIAQMVYNQAVKEQSWIEEGKAKLIGVNLYPKLEQTKKTADLYSEKRIKAVRLAEMFE